jgi:hypothetical protein
MRFSEEYSKDWVTVIAPVRVGMIDWIVNNGSEHYCSYVGGTLSEGKYAFESDEDALLFALRWS